MKHLKDFFYDKNDLVLTFVILAVAIVIIAWRMDVIMEYPATLAKETHTTTTTTTVEEIPDEPAPEDKPEEKKPEEGVKPVESLWVNGTLSKDVTVSVASGSAIAAVDSLIDAGIFDSYDQYVNTCTEHGITPEDIKTTTYTFKKGSTHADIAALVTQ